MSPEFKNLQAIIISFFREVYGHDLKHDKANDLCDFLVTRIRISEIQYFLEHNDYPLRDPDSKFSETRILDLFKVLYPVLLERKKDEYLQVFLKGILNPLLIQINTQNKNILSKWFQNNSQFNLAMTAYSNVSFLGRSEFDMARSFNEIDKELSERYFRKSLASLLKAREISIRPTDRFNYGMVGVAYHYISLSATSPAEKKMLLSEAISNMQAAEELGDYSTDHFQYLGFSLFEFACIENELSDYFRALDILEICYDKNTENSNGIVSLARCNLNIGINYSLQRDNNRLAEENAFLKSRLPGSFQMSPNYMRMVKDSMTNRQYVYRSARVINNSVNQSFNYITIDKGSIGGIRPETAVICPEGIVGVVRKVSSNYATVISLLNTRLKISAKLNDTGHFGTVEWGGTDPEYVNLNEIPLHAHVKPGDLIVTSGYSAIFPEGIPIGNVVEALHEEGESFYNIKVKLIVDFTQISNVEVIENTYRGEQIHLEKETEND